MRSLVGILLNMILAMVALGCQDVDNHFFIQAAIGSAAGLVAVCMIEENEVHHTS